MTDMIDIDSTRFGVFQVERSSLITMPSGMIGFPDHTQYAIIKQREDSVFLWMQAIDEPSLAFPVVLPWAFCWDYEVRIADEELDQLGTTDPSKLSILCVSNIGTDVRKGTVNLFSPIVINTETNEARQVINTLEGYSTRDPLFESAQQPTPVAINGDESAQVTVIGAHAA